MEFDVTVLTQLIGSLGFPIVCCGYVLVKMNKTIEENTKVTNNLCNLILQLTGAHSLDELSDNNE